MTAPAGWVQLPGGYQPNPVPQQVPQQQQGAPQQMQPQQQPPIQQPQTQWAPPGPIGAPHEGSPPYYPPVPPQLNPAFRQQQQPQFAPQQPRFAPQPPQPQQQAPHAVDANTRLQGPNIPAELQGRTLAEAMQVYNGMRNVVLQSIPGPGAPPVQAPAAPVAPVQGQPQQQSFDWRNPEDSFRRVVQGEIQSALAPVLQSTQQQSIQAARNAAAAQIGPAFVQLESQIMQRLQGADPRALATPQLWITAAESVLGNQLMQFARQQPQNGQPQTMQPQTQPQLQQPAPNLNGFFTEQPTVGVAPGGGMQLSAQQQWAAQQMGMDPSTYAAWSAGGPRR